jgi:glycosyltransferase involved in cell wall biosynthesis
MIDVALITEATYPHSYGGVSVWCDQTIRGIEERSFNVVALCATTATKPVWDFPSNVGESTTFGIWDLEKHAKVSPQRLAAVRAAFDRFLHAVLVSSDVTAFLSSLREFFEFAQDGTLGSALLTPDIVDDLLCRLAATPLRAGATPAAAPTVADGLEILTLLEHLLRPLAVPPPDAALCHSVANGLGVLVALGAKWTHNTPFLMTEHGLYLRERFLEYAPGATSHAAHVFFPKFMNQLIRAGYATADLIAPGSLYNRRWEIASGAAADRIRPIYNGIDPDSFPPPPAEPAAPTLVWLGRIDPLKDVKTLIRGFDVVRKQRPDARLRLFGGVPAGNEEYARDCHELVTELNLDDLVTFEGRVESVADAYTSGHLVLSSSISEGFPYAVLEAMASGRCVVATDVGGVEEAIGDAGVLVPPRHPEALGAACLMLLADDDRRRRLGLAGRERVRSLFTVEQSNRAYAALYDELDPRVVTPPDVPTALDSDDAFVELSFHAELEYSS